MNTPIQGTKPVMTNEDLAKLGEGQVVYIRPVTVADLRGKVQGIEKMPDEKTLYSVHAADGARMAIMDDFDAAHDAVRQNEMQPVSVH